MTGGWSDGVTLLMALILFVATPAMAAERGRSVALWVFLMLLMSPFITIIILACLGDTEEKRLER